jgi:hypothetical protein
MIEDFDSRISREALRALLALGKEFHFDPTASIEAEEYFSGLVSRHSGGAAEFKAWLRGQVKELFKCVTSAPRWIQNPEWQFSQNGPLVFVGQIDVPPGLFHDDASFFTFWDPETGATRTIVQVA